MKSISEIRINKIVRRRTRSGGNETIEFELEFNPNIDAFSIRFLAKIIDFLVYYFIIYRIIKYLNLSEDYIFFGSVFLLFAISPVLETLFGRTFGKLILLMEVVDDKCKRPNIFKSYLRNIIILFNLIDSTILFGYFFSELYIHNVKTKTYTIYCFKKKEIMKLMSR